MWGRIQLKIRHKMTGNRPNDREMFPLASINKEHNIVNMSLLTKAIHYSLQDLHKNNANISPYLFNRQFNNSTDKVNNTQLFRSICCSKRGIDHAISTTTTARSTMVPAMAATATNDAWFTILSTTGDDRFSTPSQ